MTIIYASCYSECIYESSFRTLSVHKTKENAQIALDKHKNDTLRVYESLDIELADYEEWKIIEYDLLE